MWEHVRPEGPGPGARASGTCVIVSGDKLLIFGGYNGEHFLSDMWLLHPLDPETGALAYRWEQVKQPAAAPKAADSDAKARDRDAKVRARTSAAS